VRQQAIAVATQAIQLAEQALPQNSPVVIAPPVASTTPIVTPPSSLTIPPSPTLSEPNQTSALSISLDIATPPARVITPAMGSTEVARYDFAASGGDATITDILMTTNSVNCDFMNLQLIDTATGAQVGITVPLMTAGHLTLI
jgi:hypothetical protein